MRALGVSQSKIKEIMGVLDSGKMSLTQFNEAISRAINEAYQSKLESTVNQLIARAMSAQPVETIAQ